MIEFVVKSGRLTPLCAACKEPVTGNNGWLHVDLDKARAVKRAAAEWNRSNPGPVINGAALLDYPDPAPWRAHHMACDPSGDDHDCYWFFVGRCNTWPKLVSWTGHLMGKRWLEHTDWQHVLEHVTSGVAA